MVPGRSGSSAVAVPAAGAVAAAGGARGTVLVFAGAFVYFAIFRRYGFQVEDEGTLLFQLTRVVGGQFPYTDFHTGYTPGFFYAGAAVLHALGDSTATLRPFLAALNAASVAALYALARRAAAGPWMALVPALLWLAFLPVYRDFAAANVPYPAWFATAAWMAVALALVRFVERGGLSLLVAAGVAASLAFSVKPNAGAFALAAGTWVVTLAGRHATTRDRLAGVVASLAMLAGVWLAFGLAWWSVDAVVHLVPATVLAVVVAFRRAGALATAAHPRVFPALAALAAGFVPGTLLWVVPVLGRLGVAGFARDVLLLGSPAAALYYLPHPPPEYYAVAVVAAALGLAAAGGAIRRQALAPAVPLAAGAVAVLALALRVRASGLMPESPASSLVWQLENAGYWLAPLAHWGGIVWLMRSGGRRGPRGAEEADRLRSDAATGVPDHERATTALVPLALGMYLQLYPRTDGFHLVIAMPLTVVLATVLLVRVLGWWLAAPRLAGLPSRRVVHAAVAFATLVVLAARLGPILTAWNDAVRAPALQVESPTVAARVATDTGDDLDAFGRTTAYLARHTTRGESVLAFPALTGALFAAELTSPVAHDYWYPGRPDHEEEAAMVARLRADPPRLIVTLNDGWTFFIESPGYFTTARAFAVEAYTLVARFGRFDVLARRDVASELPREQYQPRGPADAVLDADLGRRRQAVKRWMAGLTVDEAATARLEAEPRDAVLRLRAIRDGGDIRTAGWILAGYDSPHPRVRTEALGAMYLVTAGLEAMRHRWAGDVDPAVLRSYVAPYFARAEALLHAPEERARAFAAALLSLR